MYRLKVDQIRQRGSSGYDRNIIVWRSGSPALRTGSCFTATNTSLTYHVQHSEQQNWRGARSPARGPIDGDELFIRTSLISGYYCLIRRSLSGQDSSGQVDDY